MNGNTALQWTLCWSQDWLLSSKNLVWYANWKQVESMSRSPAYKVVFTVMNMSRRKWMNEDHCHGADVHCQPMGGWKGRQWSSVFSHEWMFFTNVYFQACCWEHANGLNDSCRKTFHSHTLWETFSGRLLKFLEIFFYKHSACFVHYDTHFTFIYRLDFIYRLKISVSILVKTPSWVHAVSLQLNSGTEMWSRAATFGQYLDQVRPGLGTEHRVRPHSWKLHHTKLPFWFLSSVLLDGAFTHPFQTNP